MPPSKREHDEVVKRPGPSALRSRIHEGLWGLIRLAAGAGSLPTLNGPPPERIPPRPAEALYRSAMQLKAIALDASGRRVDYESLRRSDSYQELRQHTGALPLCRIEDLGDESDRLAFWINLYNALILDALVCYDIRGRIPPILFQRAAYDVCGQRYSADDIEHGVLRGNRPHPLFRLRPFSGDDPRRQAAMPSLDPRLHFALNCGARSCPPISFYRGDTIDDQLTIASRAFLQAGGARVTLEAGRLELSRIFAWYASDFGGRQGVLQFVAGHWPHRQEAEAIQSGALRLTYTPYDWSVNALAAAEAT